MFDNTGTMYNTGHPDSYSWNGSSKIEICTQSAGSRWKRSEFYYEMYWDLKQKFSLPGHLRKPDGPSPSVEIFVNTDEKPQLT